MRDFSLATCQAHDPVTREQCGRTPAEHGIDTSRPTMADSVSHPFRGEFNTRPGGAR